MVSDEQLRAKAQSLKKALNRLEDITDSDAIQETAHELEELHFNPTLLFNVENFLFLSRQDAVAEIDRVTEMTDEAIFDVGIKLGADINKAKCDHMALFVYHFKLLTRLRKDDPEAWDEIHELYEDD